ncbi:MAG: SRPBCC domain-containing protein [Candidatus Dormibacteraceae bacterium]
MVPNQVERDILIEAPIDVVWRVITEPDYIKHWLSDDAELDLTVGGQGRLTFKTGSSFRIQVEIVEVPHRLAFRWLHPDGERAVPENSTLVELTLATEDGKTRLRVVESGFATIGWSDERKEREVQEHSNGWQSCLDRVEEFAPQARSAGQG